MALLGVRAYIDVGLQVRFITPSLQLNNRRLCRFISSGSLWVQFFPVRHAAPQRIGTALIPIETELDLTHPQNHGQEEEVCPIYISPHTKLITLDVGLQVRFITPSLQLNIREANEFLLHNTNILSDPQKSFNHDGQGGFHFSLTPYPAQHGAEMFSVSNQAISVSLGIGNPFLKNHFATAGQNVNGNNLKKLPLHAGIPVTGPQSSLPTIGAFAGMTKSCNVSPSASSAQLTIFYGGTVNVFDDISAEKAQAIMLVAGNGLSLASNMAQTKVLAPGSQLVASDCVPVSQPRNTPPCSGRSSPVSVSSHTGAQSGSGSTSTDEFLAVKTTDVPTTPVSNVECPKVVSAATMLTSAVPQARKASLARFLEKRKERVMNSAPYSLNKKSEECTTA